ncbi:hypothetical protein QBC39DRAFT_112543 [Podospora conica]|nr:hypothetical protein QBC39DRAFT_112543 [Schizothecium conicum]
MADSNISARQARGFFIAPKDADLTWILGDQQTISWNTEYPHYTVGIWQEDPEGKSARSGLVILSQSDTKNGQYGLVDSFTWAVQTYHFDLNRSNQFFFWVFNTSDSAEQELVNKAGATSSAARFTSPVFFVRAKPDSSSSTTVVASSTASATSSAAPTSSQSTASGERTEGVSSGSVPIAVPVALGVLLGLAALAGLGWFLWRRSKKKKAVAPLGNGDKVAPAAEVHAYHRPVEVPGEGRAHELG